MRLFSWNVNGIRAVMKKWFPEILQKLNPDIIGLQEIKAKPEQIIVETDIIQSLGYQCIFNSAERPGYSGTAVFTKIAPLAVMNRIGTEADNEGRTLALEFEDFYYVNSYIPNSKDDLSRLEYRQEWDRAMCVFLDKLQVHKPVIFCGDLNVAHQPIDLKNPKQNEGEHGFTLEERRGFDAFMNIGLIDIFREKNPELTGAYTWWSNFWNARANNSGWRIDYFLASRNITSRITDATIHPDIMGSDHCPVGIVLQ